MFLARNANIFLFALGTAYPLPLTKVNFDSFLSDFWIGRFVDAFIQSFLPALSDFLRESSFFCVRPSHTSSSLSAFAFALAFFGFSVDGSSSSSTSTSASVSSTSSASSSSFARKPTLWRETRNFKAWRRKSRFSSPLLPPGTFPNF